MVKADITWSLTQVVNILDSKASMQHPSSLLSCTLSPPCPCPHTVDSGQGHVGVQDFISLLILSLEHSFSNL